MGRLAPAKRGIYRTYCYEYMSVLPCCCLVTRAGKKRILLPGSILLIQVHPAAVYNSSCGAAEATCSSSENQRRPYCLLLRACANPVRVWANKRALDAANVGLVLLVLGMLLFLDGWAFGQQPNHPPACPAATGVVSPIIEKHRTACRYPSTYPKPKVLAGQVLHTRKVRGGGQALQPPLSAPMLASRVCRKRSGTTKWSQMKTPTLDHSGGCGVMGLYTSTLGTDAWAVHVNGVVVQTSGRGTCCRWIFKGYATTAISNLNAKSCFFPPYCTPPATSEARAIISTVLSLSLSLCGGACAGRRRQPHARKKEKRWWCYLVVRNSCIQATRMHLNPISSTALSISGVGLPKRGGRASRVWLSN
ncbi:hypothetical protein ACQKWADRAFT_211294 [Trichoderma austrokoningii]